MNYIVRWGTANSQRATASKFAAALTLAKGLLESQSFGGHREAPTIRHALNADENTDGLTPEQREACEAIGLEVERP